MRKIKSNQITLCLHILSIRIILKQTNKIKHYLAVSSNRATTLEALHISLAKLQDSQSPEAIPTILIAKLIIKIKQVFSKNNHKNNNKKVLFARSRLIYQEEHQETQVILKIFINRR